MTQAIGALLSILLCASEVEIAHVHSSYIKHLAVQVNDVDSTFLCKNVEAKWISTLSCYISGSSG